MSVWVVSNHAAACLSKATGKNTGIADGTGYTGITDPAHGIQTESAVSTRECGSVRAASPKSIALPCVAWAFEAAVLRQCAATTEKGAWRALRSAPNDPRKPAGCPSPPTSTASSTSRFKSLISLSTLRSFRKEHSRRRGSALSFSRDCPIAAVRAMSNQILIPVSRA